MDDSAHRKSSGKLRIISGQWRGRNLRFNPAHDIRPTPNRVRETLFNWLQPHINGATCLDLFAGSGALGFEAASRGALKVTLVDQSRVVCQQLRGEVERFEADNITVVQQDAERYIETAAHADIWFLDPPFGGAILDRALRALHLSAKAAFVYIEMPADTPTPGQCDAWECLHQAQASDVAYHLYAISHDA